MKRKLQDEFPQLGLAQGQVEALIEELFYSGTRQPSAKPSTIDGEMIQTLRKIKCPYCPAEVQARSGSQVTCGNVKCQNKHSRVVAERRALRRKQKGKS